MSSSSSTNPHVTTAQAHQASSSTFQQNQRVPAMTQSNHRHPLQSSSQRVTHLDQDVDYLSQSAPKDQEISVSAALHKLSQHHMMQQANKSLLKRRTYSASAISSVHTINNHPTSNLSNHYNHVEDLSKLVAAKQDQSTKHIGTTNTRQNRAQDQLDRYNEETTIKEEELENDLECLKETDLEALSSLERNLPIELSFLIRQQAYCMARMNYLDRQIRELQEAARWNHQQSYSHQQIGVSPTQVSSSTSNVFNQQFHSHQNPRILYGPNGATIPTATRKAGNFIMSDDSGGEYSRATISDDDELSSLLDQIAKSINNSQSMPPTHQMPVNQLHQRQVVAPSYHTIQSSHQQPLQHYAWAPSHHIHPAQQQAVPIFVMGSPIVPVAHHPSGVSSNILPGVHFQPEPRYNQYYEDLYCSGPSRAQPVVSDMPRRSSMMQQRQQTQQQQQQRQQQDISHQSIAQKDKDL